MELGLGLGFKVSCAQSLVNYDITLCMSSPKHGPAQHLSLPPDKRLQSGSLCIIGDKLRTKGYPPFKGTHLFGFLVIAWKNMPSQREKKSTKGCKSVVG
jgi:hypothetical protein